MRHYRKGASANRYETAAHLGEGIVALSYPVQHGINGRFLPLHCSTVYFTGGKIWIADDFDASSDEIEALFEGESDESIA